MRRALLLGLLWACAVALVAQAATLALPPVTFTGGAPTGPYVGWANYPQSPFFIPISVWFQRPTDTGYGAFKTNGQAALATKINTYYDGGYWTPSGFGTGDTNGFFASVYNLGLYFIPHINTGAGRTPNDTDNNSIASMMALAASVGHSSNILGWSMGDEPETGTVTTWPMSALPSQIATVKGYDPTRPVLLNSTDYVFNSGLETPVSLNTNYIAALGIASFDEYPVTNPWWCDGTSCGSPRDAMWIQGWSITKMESVRAPGAPFWAFVESGTDDLGGSSGNGNTCNSTTNICTPNMNEQRATPAQVNAEVWMSIINGATGIEWFCHDTTGVGLCLGQGGGALATSIQANLTYVDTQLLAFAPEINSSTLGRCTMITGQNFANFVTSCTNGDLTLKSSNASMPASALVKSYGGAHYVFAQPARNGTGSLSITLAGDANKVATVVYDSDAQYDAVNSNAGKTITLDASGQFVDVFGAGGNVNDNYQTKIYVVR